MKRQSKGAKVQPFDKPVPHAIWGAEQVDAEAIEQLRNACRLPIAVRGAQMPDGHVGYGLPIGGVLATREAVIPYGVGVDIACRMKMSITELSSDRLEGLRDRLRKALRSETRFGVGSAFEARTRRDHAVMEDPLWGQVDPEVRHLRDKAWEQLGTSGSGNHFVEWGELLVKDDSLEIPAGRYLALLSHSGSRGLGANIASTYTRIAREKTPLDSPFTNLAWLDLKSDAGRAYWNAMTMAGNYASANHDLIHRHVLRAGVMKPLIQIENHHNFAWREEHDGESLIVHRKGATPAGRGVLGIIPGSMGDPGFIVRGLGNAASLNSAAHGAGRRMSRKKAKESITRSQMLAYLRDRGIELMDAGIDEAPQVYKSITEVMAAQADLVEIVAEFHPRIVLMASGGPAED
jgi:tRNA-splicing ligase RtcB